HTDLKLSINSCRTVGYYRNTLVYCTEYLLLCPVMGSLVSRHHNTVCQGVSVLQYPSKSALRPSHIAYASASSTEDAAKLVVAPMTKELNRGLMMVVKRVRVAIVWVMVEIAKMRDNLICK
ncbi:hypothetical protein PIB30_068341, partial [Stylosanthes scabra]|nr:hypothetical protein [Stylosanthes scabra]